MLLKAVDAVTVEDAVGMGETVRFIVVPSSRVVFSVIERPVPLPAVCSFEDSCLSLMIVQNPGEGVDAAQMRL